MANRDIYVGYHDHGGEFASLLTNKLRERRYSVFNASDTNEMAECRDVVLIMTNGCLDGSEKASDWMRLQIEEALKEQKNIVPILADAFEYPKDLPKSIQQIRGIRSLRMSSDVPDNKVAELCSGYLLSKPKKNYTKLIIILIILLILIAALIGLLGKDIMYLLFPKATVSGIVTDVGTSVPIPGAVIDWTEDRTLTDENGAYSVKVKPGTYTLAYSAEGYESVELEMTLANKENAEKDVALSTGHGTVTGTVTSRRDSMPIEGASVSCGDVSTQTDAEGKYSVTLKKGAQTITFQKDGYTTVELETDVPADAGTTLDAVLSDGSATLSGVVINAVDGAPIPDAKVTAGETTLTTGSDGTYSVVLPAGTNTVKCEAEGYIAIEEEITMEADTDMRKDLVLSQMLASDQYRVVLTWGASPSDLDSHLVGDDFHIWFNEKTTPLADAMLDLDDITSFGPETTTFTADPDKKYVFYVHNYSKDVRSGRVEIPDSGAKVAVYRGDHLISTSEPPSGAGSYWKVFTVENGEPVFNNEMCLTGPNY